MSAQTEVTERERKALLRGDIYMKVREARVLPIGRQTPARTIRAMFGVGPDDFWKAVSDLASIHDVVATDAGIEYVEPAKPRT
jgi:hypothetical protein